MPRMCLVSSLEYTALPTLAAGQRILEAPPPSTSCNENDNKNDDPPPPPPYTATFTKMRTNNNNNGSSTDVLDNDNNNIDSSSSSSSSSNDDTDARRGQKRKNCYGGQPKEQIASESTEGGEEDQKKSSDDLSFHTANSVDSANNNDKLFTGEHDDNCYICDQGGKLICCDYCSKVYHLDCHIPVVDVDSIDDTTLWQCMNCCGSRSRTSMANDCNDNNCHHIDCIIDRNRNNNHSMANKVIVLDTSNDEEDNAVKYHESPTKCQKVIDDDFDNNAAADNDENEKKIYDDNDNGASDEVKPSHRYEYGDRYSEQNVRARKNPDGTVLPATAPKLLADGTFAKPSGRQRKGMDWDAIKGCWFPVPGVTQTNQNNDNNEIVIGGVVIKDVHQSTIDNSNYNNNNNINNNINNNNINNDTINENGFVHKNYKDNTNNDSEIVNNDDDDVVAIYSKEDRAQMAHKNGQPPINQLLSPPTELGTTALAPPDRNNCIMNYICEADNISRSKPHTANESNKPPKNKTASHSQIGPPVQSTTRSSNTTGNNNTTRVNNTAGSTVSKKTNTTTSHHNHNQKPSGLPVRERFSEYQIDNASSITELESIRRRLLTLLDRTEIRLREMRVAEALIGPFGKGNMEGLSMKELMTKLVGGEKESNDSIETTSDIETSTHKGHIPVTCPLCFEKISSPQSSSSIVTCHICGVDGMCSNCHEQCTSCHLSTCADCLMSCDRCVSNYHCSDCMGIGHGKCVSCRKNLSKGFPTKNASKKQQGSKVIDKSTKNAVSSLSRGNQMLALGRNKQHEHPPLNHQPLSVTHEEMETRREQAQSAAGHVVPGTMSQHQAEISATIGSLSTDPPSVHNPSAMTIQRAQVAAGSEPRATHPIEESTTTISQFHKTSTTVAERLFSVHRFLISDAGTIGLNIMLLKSLKKCIISDVHSDSIAVNHGIEEGDEILPSHDNDDIYHRFISVSKQRPLLFEVKRLYKHPGRLFAQSSGAPVPHSLHRFIITTSGPLGVTTEKVGSMILLRIIAPMSVADIHGLQNDDILCIPYKKGQLQQSVSLFVDAVKGGIRPMIIEVWRAVPPISSTSATFSVLPKINNDAESKVEKEIICIDNDDVDENVSVSSRNWVCDICHLEFASFDEAAACENNHLQEN